VQVEQLAVLYSFVSSYGLNARVVSSLVQGGTLIQANDGNFYLTTEAGGTSNNGTVFRITPREVVACSIPFEVQVRTASILDRCFRAAMAISTGQL
jgi:uncharacterized repeat protein (TIGR03803 family)